MFNEVSTVLFNKKTIKKREVHIFNLIYAKSRRPSACGLTLLKVITRGKAAIKGGNDQYSIFYDKVDFRKKKSISTKA